MDRRGTVSVAPRSLPPPTDVVRAAVDVDDPVDPADPMLFHKSSLRRRYEEASARHPDADDVLFTNTRGELTEINDRNVAVELDGAWITPPLDCGLLPGVGRRSPSMRAGSRRCVRIDDLPRATSLALVSDVRGRRPIQLTN